MFAIDQMKRLILIFVLCGLLLPSAYGETISYTLSSGAKYVGEVKNGKMHGQGTYTFASGNKYVGQFKDGKRHGQGTYTYADGRKYVGEWEDSKPHGQGTYTFANGDKYVGGFKDGKKDGQGTQTFANGDKYVGKFKDNNGWNVIKYNNLGQVIGKRIDGMAARVCDEMPSRRFWGTGFAVNQYHVITNAHVLYCCKKVTVYNLPSCSNAEVATIVATEQKSDLGLLRLGRPLKHYATLRSGKELQLGEAVSTYDRRPTVNGCPRYVMGQGKVTKLNWRPDDPRLMVHDSPTSSGASGGPVLDALGRIAGVHVKGRRSETAAIKPYLLKAFLKSNNIEYNTAPSTEELSLSEIKEKSDKFTVIIKCIR